MLVIPYQVDVPMKRWPIMNFVIIGMTFVAFAAGMNTVGATEVPGFALQGWTLKGLFGHMWAHAGAVHLACNMLFLWVFGNAICAKLGNPVYVLLYVGLGVIAALPQAFAGTPTIGASGAINGVVGIFLIFYPLNAVSCVAWFFPLYVRKFSISSYWMILLWFVFDVAALVAGGASVAYAAHLVGFGAGAALGIVLLRTGMVQPGPYERTLLEVVGGSRRSDCRR